MTVRRALLIGLGTIARTHLAVLSRRTDVVVVGGVDPSAVQELPFPVFAELDEAISAGLDPDLVVVATPTDTHVTLVGEVLSRTDALVLSEKPLARTVASMAELRTGRPPELLSSRVKVAHHFAFSPEVDWARAHVAAHPHWGPPSRILSVFNDAYGGLPPSRLDSYVSSWVDSGPNQLSSLAPFAGGWRLVAHDSQGSRASTALEHDGGSTLLTSNWLAGDTSKQTTLEFRGGAVQLRMDHTSMTALVLEDGVVTEHVGYVGTAGRKEAHYLRLYDALVSDPDDARLGLPLAVEIARLLEDADASAAEPAQVRWSSIAEAGGSGGPLLE